MAQSVQELMTPNPTTYPATTSLTDAARAMRDEQVGDVLVERDGTVCGIVTDRDIVVRTVAEGGDPADVRLASGEDRQLTRRLQERRREERLRRIIQARRHDRTEEGSRPQGRQGRRPEVMTPHPIPKS